MAQGRSGDLRRSGGKDRQVLFLRQSQARRGGLRRRIRHRSAGGRGWTHLLHRQNHLSHRGRDGRPPHPEGRLRVRRLSGGEVDKTLRCGTRPLQTPEPHRRLLLRVQLRSLRTGLSLRGCEPFPRKDPEEAAERTLLQPRRGNVYSPHGQLRQLSGWNKLLPQGKGCSLRIQEGYPEGNPPQGSPDGGERKSHPLPERQEDSL